jgi:site-specific recombinase XerD
LDKVASRYAAQADAPNTLRAYRADLQHYAAWCDRAGLQALPAAPETVGRYLAAHAADYSTATLQRRLVAISRAHKQAGHRLDTQHPAIRDTWKGIRRERGTAQKGKAPLLGEDVRQIVAALPETLQGHRDRALFLVGFASAMRRSELAGLRVDDATFTRHGLVIALRRSKTDQEGQGRKVAIPYGSRADTCPVRALRTWLDMAEIESGPLFRGVTRYDTARLSPLSAASVAYIIKRAVEAAGLDPAHYAGHSLRSGHATSAAQAGASERKIMDQTGHRSERMVRRYIRDANLFHDNSAGALGL